MTPAQFDALAQLMRLRTSPSREALRMVLVDGITQSAAAHDAGIPASNVSRQVASARKVIALAERLAAPPHMPPGTPSARL